MEEVVADGNDIKPALPLVVDRSCELAVECWQLRRELQDRKAKTKLAEDFIAKLQKDITRHNHNLSTQRSELKEKDKLLYELKNEMVEQKTKITDLEMSNHGLVQSLRKRRAELEAMGKAQKALGSELEEFKRKSAEEAAAATRTHKAALQAVQSKLATTTSDLESERKRRTVLEAETKKQQDDIRALRNEVATLKVREANLAPRSELMAVKTALESTAAGKAALEAAHSELQSKHSATVVSATELGDSFQLLRTEFRLLLSQPQFKNVRVSNKISRLLNAENPPAVSPR